MGLSCADEVKHYVRTGNREEDSYGAWPGEDFFARATNAKAALREALVSEVRKRSPRATVPDDLAELNVAAFARVKITPMVRGLFPRADQQTVLDVLVNSVRFLTPANIEDVLRRTRWHRTAWDLANLYLGSFDAELLAEDAPAILGLSEETTCFVSVEYFRSLNRFEDYVVHETAHIFHNCKRRTIGLKEVRRREWLLDIDYGRRETFAYACETYSRILELSDGVRARRDLLAEHLNEPIPGQDKVEPAEYADILREAVEARNGWKRILARCAARPLMTPAAVTLTPRI